MDSWIGLDWVLQDWTRQLAVTHSPSAWSIGVWRTDMLGWCGLVCQSGLLLLSTGSLTRDRDLQVHTHTWESLKKKGKIATDLYNKHCKFGLRLMNFSELLNHVINGPVNVVGYGTEEITVGFAGVHYRIFMS